jgi:aminopeptidase N
MPKIYVRKSQAGKFKQHEKEVFSTKQRSRQISRKLFRLQIPVSEIRPCFDSRISVRRNGTRRRDFFARIERDFPDRADEKRLRFARQSIFHEAAHQWFGDTVTMKWFDDLWLKEGFAEFMAYKTLEKVMPEYNAWKIFYERNKQAAYLTDSTRGTTPIYQEIPNLSAAKSAYGNIVYRKAPSFLKQAEFYLGEKEFQTAVRAFLKKHELPTPNGRIW